eukprot:COSAG01_NODE_85_length_27670_cov_34.051467_9_plen_88_part_00
MNRRSKAHTANQSLAQSKLWRSFAAEDKLFQLAKVERADRASHIAQNRLGSAALKGAGPMLPTDGRCARLSIRVPSCSIACGRQQAV